MIPTGKSVAAEPPGAIKLSIDDPLRELLMNSLVEELARSRHTAHCPCIGVLYPTE